MPYYRAKLCTLILYLQPWSILQVDERASALLCKKHVFRNILFIVQTNYLP